MPPPARPIYVHRWRETGSLQPFDATHAKMYGFLFEGRKAALEALCARHLNPHPDQKIRFEPVSHHVLITFADIEAVTATRPPFKNYGRNPEKELTIWVLVRRRDTGGLSLFAPYCLLDNPLAVQHGREIYGFPKEMARFPSWVADDLRVEAYTFEVFAPGTVGKFRRVLSVTREHSTIGDLLERTFSQPLELASELVPHLLEVLPEALWPPHGPIVFLKQLPDAADGTYASYQAIVEAEIAVTRVHSVRWHPGTFALTLERCAGHPFEDDLGIESGAEALVNFSVDFDFHLAAGKELWRAVIV